MSQPSLAENVPWATSRAVGYVVLLFAAIIGGAVAASEIEPVASVVVLVAAIPLYPGFAGIFAARSRSSDTVITVATLLASFLFVLVASQFMFTPWGFAGRRVVAFVTGLCLLFAGTLFATLLLAVRAARPGGARREVAALGIGVMGVVLIAAPYVWASLLVI